MYDNGNIDQISTPKTLHKERDNTQKQRRMCKNKCAAPAM